MLMVELSGEEYAGEGARATPASGGMVCKEY